MKIKDTFTGNGEVSQESLYKEDSYKANRNLRLYFKKHKLLFMKEENSNPKTYSPFMNSLKGFDYKSLDLQSSYIYTKILEVRGHLGNPSLHRSQKSLSIGQKNGLWIYDGSVLRKSLIAAYTFLKYFKLQGGNVLVVNKEDSLKSAVKFFCNKTGFFHMQEKWMGGLLTNWTQADKQKTHFLKVQETHGNLLDQTGDRLYLKVKSRFKGIENMHKRPSLCIILDIQENNYALKEALKLRIPVMAFVNTDDDLEGVDFPIFGANKSLLWVRWVFNFFLYCDSLEEGVGLKSFSKEKNR